VDWTLVHSSSLDWAREHAGKLVGTKAELLEPGLLQTTRKSVNAAVTNWIEAGEPLSALRDKLEPTFGKARADMIATTEVTKARYEGNQMVWKEANIPENEWDTARDRFVCPICESLQGARAKTGEAFYSDPAKGGDGNYYRPPVHPRCRCDALPVTGNG